MEKQVFTLLCIIILSGVTVGMIVMQYDPFSVGEAIKTFFFGSLFVFMWGLGTLAFFILNIGTTDRWADSFRRGLFLSLVFLLLVVFKRSDIFSWYVGAILGGIFIAAEIWFYRRISKQVNLEE